MTDDRDLKYDIFISYAPGDRDWVTHFAQDIAHECDQLFGKKLTIVSDQPELDFARNRVRRAALFMPVFSPAYVSSARAMAEMQAFFLDVPHANDRTLSLEILPVAEDRYPYGIASREPPLRFWAEYRGRITTLTRHSKTSIYNERVHDLAYDIEERLRELSKPSSGATPGPPPSSPTDISPAPASPMRAPDIVFAEPSYSPGVECDITGDRSGGTRIEDEEPATDVVEFGLSHPRRVGVGASFLADAWIFRHEDRDDAISRAIQSVLEPVHFRAGGSSKIARGTEMTVKLEFDSWKVEPEWQNIHWDGQITNVSFRITPTRALPARQVIGVCQILVNGFRIGQIFFGLPVVETAGSHRPETELVSGQFIKSAFASYASKDRRRVLARVQGIEKLRIKVFLDARDFRANDQYPAELLKHIDASDMLYLFWSHAASRSPWVEREWRYGLKQKGLDFIDPVPLVDPRKVPPPAELGEIKHFNDWTLAYLEYEKAVSGWDRFRAWLAGD